MKTYLILLGYLLRTICIGVHAEGNDREVIRSVAGYNATLPCRVSKKHGDSRLLTLWYIENESTPVYSYDARKGHNGSHWFNATAFSYRANFHPQWSPPSLEIGDVKPKDARLYRCRVDFQNSHSKVAWIRLHVIEPPKSVVVVRESTVLLGQKNEVYCKVIGGNPPPQVLWLRYGEVIDSTYEETSGQTINFLDTTATRDDLQSIYTCQAINNHLRRPQDGSYYRNVTTPPFDVSIATNDETIQDGRTARLTCRASGSNPPSQLSWHVHGKSSESLYSSKAVIITNSLEVGEKDNVSVSVLTINASIEDHNKKFICKAVNELLPSQFKQQFFKLSVFFKPVIHMVLGRSLDKSNIKEGNDVFFECKVRSNPPPYKVEWFHNGKKLSQSVANGILVSESILVLQRVRQSYSGKYMCKVSNVEGDSTSNQIQISIKYSPRCAITPQLLGVGLRETTNVSCIVDADPPDVQFRWTFNNSVRKDQSEVVSSDRFIVQDLESVLIYTPQTERDYGTLLCFASNIVGAQDEPCSFTIISAGPPEPLENCSLVNITTHSSSVICIPGFNGGLPQRFLLQVWMKNGEQVVNYSSSTTDFLVRSLAPGRHYTIAVSSYNSKGSTQAHILYLQTLKEVDAHKSLPSRTEPTQIVMVAGVLGMGVILLGISFMLWFVRCRQKNEPESKASIPKVQSANPDLLDLTSREKDKAKPLGEVHYLNQLHHAQFSEDEEFTPVSERTNLSATFSGFSPLPSGAGQATSQMTASLKRGSDIRGNQKYKGCTRRLTPDDITRHSSLSQHQPLILSGESVL